MKLADYLFGKAVGLRTGFVVMALAGTSLFSSVGRAALVYSYVTDQTSYNVAPGSNVTVLVFLKETGGTMVATDNGLFDAGFSVTRSAAGLPALPSVIASIAGSVTTNGSNFPGGLFTEAGGDTTAFRAGEDNVHNGNLTGPTPTGGLIEIGSVTVTGGTTLGTTTFTLGNYLFPTSGAPSSGHTADQASRDLDVTNASPAYTGASGAAGQQTFTVITPEPTSLALLTFGGAGLLIRRRKSAR